MTNVEYSRETSQATTPLLQVRKSLDRSVRTRLQKITKRKAIDRPISATFCTRFGLSKEAIEDRRRISSCQKQYRNWYYCSTQFVEMGGKIITRYCNFKGCSVCQPIRSAKFIRGYGEQIKDIVAKKEGWFLTLTLPTVAAKSVLWQRKRFSSFYRKVTDERYQVKNHFDFIRVVEAHPSKSDKSRVHMHLHYFVDGKNNAEWLRALWLAHFKEAEAWCQDLRQAYSKDPFSVAKELLKYMSKPLVVKKVKGYSYFDEQELDTMDAIYCGLKSYRTVQVGGSIRRVPDEISAEDEELETEGGGEKIAFWTFCTLYGLYINDETGVVLADVKHATGLKKVLVRLANRESKGLAPPKDKAAEEALWRACLRKKRAPIDVDGLKSDFK